MAAIDAYKVIIILIAAVDDLIIVLDMHHTSQNNMTIWVMLNPNEILSWRALIAQHQSHSDFINYVFTIYSLCITPRTDH